MESDTITVVIIVWSNKMGKDCIIKTFVILLAKDMKERKVTNKIITSLLQEFYRGSIY